MKHINTIILFAILVSLVSLLAFKHISPKSETKGEALLPNTKMSHIGIVVDNIEASLDNWMELIGSNNRPPVKIAEGHEDNPTCFKGELSGAKAKLAFIQLENLQVELIEPIGDENSFWREFLDEHGPIVHHAGFSVTGIGEHYIDLFEKAGYPLIQHGGWNGGEYGYMDTQKDLGIVIELLEQYPKNNK